jgi:hypothetical protein
MMIQRYYPDTWNAMEFLQSNPHQFPDIVYYPTVLGCTAVEFPELYDINQNSSWNTPHQAYADANTFVLPTAEGVCEFVSVMRNVGIRVNAITLDAYNADNGSTDFVAGLNSSHGKLASKKLYKSVICN